MPGGRRAGSPVVRSVRAPGAAGIVVSAGALETKGLVSLRRDAPK